MASKAGQGEFQGAGMKSVNEGGTLYFTVKFYNVSDELFAPTAVQYRIDCLTTGSEARDWTSVTPATSVTLAVTGDDNQIFNELNAREVRQMVVKYTDLSGNDQHSQIQWRVDNLQGVT